MLMHLFLQHLKRGLEKDQALRQAKGDYLKGEGKKHPFYWASFVMVGDDAPIEVDNQRPGYGIFLLAFLLLVGGGYFYWKNRLV